MFDRLRRRVRPQAATQPTQVARVTTTENDLMNPYNPASPLYLLAVQPTLYDTSPTPSYDPPASYDPAPSYDGGGYDGGSSDGGGSSGGDF